MIKTQLAANGGRTGRSADKPGDCVFAIDGRHCRSHNS